MKVSKHIRFTVRVRDYESAYVEVGFEGDHHDLGFADEDWAELRETRSSWIDQLELLVITEVEKLAREELERINSFSEAHNIADDFLSTAPLHPANPQRSQHGTGTKKVGSTPSRRGIRREGGSSRTPTPPAA